ncbi:hypothetical protein TNCV_3285501 [Trichonephila clavipes]|nr:hypothetical protein TNCV_3285501 [Trichonephila clavipes]
MRSQPWRLEQTKKNGRTGPKLCSFPVLQFFWGSSRSQGCSQWVGCPAEGTGITHVQVLQQTLQVKPMAKVCFLASALDSDRWSTRRGLETRYRAISLHNIHPTPLEPIESKWLGFSDHVVSKPYMPNGISWIWHTESPQSLNEGSFFFGSLLLQVVTGNVVWIKTSKGSDARNVQRMMIREPFGQQLHNSLFSVSVEVNNLGRLQAVDKDSKLRHKRNEIREMHSLVFYQVYLKCLVGLHVYEATGFRVLLLY